MEVLILQVFVSLMLVLSSVILFAFTTKNRTFDHADRLALLPVDDDGVPPTPVVPAPTEEGKES